MDNDEKDLCHQNSRKVAARSFEVSEVSQDTISLSSVEKSREFVCTTDFPSSPLLFEDDCSEEGDMDDLPKGLLNPVNNLEYSTELTDLYNMNTQCSIDHGSENINLMTDSSQITSASDVVGDIFEYFNNLDNSQESDFFSGRE